MIELQEVIIAALQELCSKANSKIVLNSDSLKRLIGSLWQILEQLEEKDMNAQEKDALLAFNAANLGAVIPLVVENLARTITRAVLQEISIKADKDISSRSVMLKGLIKSLQKEFGQSPQEPGPQGGHNP